MACTELGTEHIREQKRQDSCTNGACGPVAETLIIPVMSILLQTQHSTPSINPHPKQSQTKPWQEVTFGLSPKKQVTAYTKIYDGTNVQIPRIERSVGEAQNMKCKVIQNEQREVRPDHEGP